MRLRTSDTVASTSSVEIKQEPLSDEGDNSPPRRRQLVPDSVEIKQEVDSDGDISPPRRGGGDLSPPRRRKPDDDGDISPPRRRRLDVDVKQEVDSDGDISPPRMTKKKGLMSKTLDGKRAGLQDAKGLKEEMEKLKKKEKEMFKNVSLF